MQSNGELFLIVGVAAGVIGTIANVFGAFWHYLYDWITDKFKKSDEQ